MTLQVRSLGLARKATPSLLRQPTTVVSSRCLAPPALGFHESSINTAGSQRRELSTNNYLSAAGPSVFGSSSSSSNHPPSSYFQRPSLPTNTIIRFVPQQTAWVVERMGKFNKILSPGLAILIPFLDRIAYVKSLKEAAMEIPSQSAITADNVTLELDGVLYTRVFDAYKAR